MLRRVQNVIPIIRDRLGDGLEGAGDRGQAGGALRGKAEPRPVALEEPHVERQLEGADLVADGAVRDVELGRRLGHRAMPRRRLEGAPWVERRKSVGHRPPG
jgi:hypothetical protein